MISESKDDDEGKQNYLVQVNAYITAATDKSVMEDVDKAYDDKSDTKIEQYKEQMMITTLPLVAETAQGTDVMTQWKADETAKTTAAETR